MATQHNNSHQDNTGFSSQTIADAVKVLSSTAGEKLGAALYEWIKHGTERIGDAVTPIAMHPFTKFATKVPGINWLMAALGQVNVELVQRDIDTLRTTYPADSTNALAQRIITDTAWKAAGIGLATNFIPPLALTLLAVDIGAISALQAEMVYRIAAIYGFSPTEPARRGEVLALWGLFTGSSGMVKAGMSIVEVIPVIGAAIGSTGNAAMLYGLGQVAYRFYEAKQRADVAEEGDRIDSI